MDYKETIKQRINILPENLKAFVLSEDWRKNSEKIGRDFLLNEEKNTLLENEIFLILLGFEPVKDFEENIKQGLNIEPLVLSQIVNEVNQKIFFEVYGELDYIDKEITKKDGVKKNNIGSSFEQIILNQAIAMQPAREEGGRDMSKETRDMIKNQIPENLPVEEKIGESEPKNIHNYESGRDPYREPLE